MIACLAVHVPSSCARRFFGLFYLLWRLGHLLTSIAIVYFAKSTNGLHVQRNDIACIDPCFAN